MGQQGILGAVETEISKRSGKSMLCEQIQAIN